MTSMMQNRFLEECDDVLLMVGFVRQKPSLFRTLNNYMEGSGSATIK